MHFWNFANNLTFDYGEVFVGGLVTKWLGELRAGDKEAAGKIFAAYSSKLAELAKQDVWGVVGRVADEDDVIQDVFLSFIEAIDDGRLKEVEDSEGLLRLLCVITRRRAINQNVFWTADKRGDGKVRGHSVFKDLTDLVAGEDHPQAFMEQQAQDLISSLNDPVLEVIAAMTLDGKSQKTIGAKLKVAPITVRRKLAIIRKIWGDLKN